MAGKVKIKLANGQEKEYDVGRTLEEILLPDKEPGCPLIALVDGEVEELSKRIHYDVEVQPITINNSLGVRTYMRSLSFLLIKAVEEVFPGSRVTIEHSLSKGLYGEIYNGREITDNDILLIKTKMKELVIKDEKIEKIKVNKDEAIKIFKRYGMNDKLRLLKHIEQSYINIYKCGYLYDYFYGPMVPSMGYLKIFDIMRYNRGFILTYPHEDDPVAIPVFKDLPKLAKVFKETEDWSKILDVGCVGALNDKVESGEIEEIILVAEGLHEKKIANIADKIYENIDKIKIVLIAGPSSSGKTTFSKRLSIQLRVLGLRPFAISLDDYFVDRERTPKDEKGNYDFESIKALDLELFNKHLTQLLSGEEVEFPVFNFKTGSREWSGRKYRMQENSILVIEGIHGLNEVLTKAIPRENKYKIYISALTQLNIDDHNRIPTTDVRMLRRIVRDNMSRGRNAEATILSWKMVRDGEEKNIFPFQEEADTMFNSTLVYEMSILKKYAEPLLREIKKESPAYIEAKRLLIFLSYFKSAGEEIIPNNSIIREFIGRSCFYK
ncbi:ATPase AAA [Fervidicella metallireducens AeB]|uniref:ATPase AAA n=1 Tax=Fervidicella metallireducens AeB TaxID=1403537 RepID=A0A017RXF3_9CLOT|nr:nucleoside kinase [Fervidicella metallireducens]EYE89049.1 ATPase AAA [Fervidicella metallireducens AeB]